MADHGRAQQIAVDLPNNDLSLADWIEVCILRAKKPPCFTKNPANFSAFFNNVLALEAKHIMTTGPVVNLTSQLTELLRFDKCNSIMDKDLFFYAVLFHHLVLWKEVYMVQCANDLFEKVTERLKCIPVMKLIHMLKNGILPIVSHCDHKLVNWQQWETVYVDALPGICEQWLSICQNEKKNLSQERYIYVAILSVTIGIKIGLCHGKVSTRKTSKWWSHLLVQPCKYIAMDEQVLMDLSEGLKFMLECDVPPEHMITLEHLQNMVSTGPNGRVRSLAVARDFLEVITSYCQLEHWERDAFLNKFLRPLRLVYKDKHYRVRMGITLWTSRGGINDLTKEQGASLVDIIDQGLQFILTVLKLLHGRIYRNYDEECGKWIKLLLNLVDYNDQTAPQCIQLLTDPSSQVFQRFESKIKFILNTNLLNHLKKSTMYVGLFMEVYDSASDIWQRQLLEKFIENKLPDNSRLSDRGWKRLIQQFEKSYKNQPSHQQRLLVPLLEKFATQYQSNKRLLDMIVHLLQLDTPCLFMTMPAAGSDPSQHEPREFKEFLTEFINLNHLQKQFLHEYEVLLENTSFVPDSFQVLIVSIILQAIFAAKHRVNTTSSRIASSALYVLNEANGNRCLDMKSAKVRLASGLLYHLSSFIHPKRGDLKWLSDNSSDVCKLAQVYKLVAKSDLFKSIALVEDRSRLEQYGRAYPRDVLRFFNFILEVKEVLREWSRRVLKTQVTLQNIGHLTSLVQTITDLVEYLGLTDICISDERLMSIKDEYQVIADDLESVLVRRIKEISTDQWCCLEQLLEKHGVGFSKEISDGIDKLVDLSNVRQQRTSIIKPDAYVCDLQHLLHLVNEFIKPLESCLDVLVFFQLQQSNLFKRYLLAKSQSQLPITMEHLNVAVNSTVDLIWKLCDGSATVQEVTLCDSLQLEHIDVKKEHDILSHFAKLFSDKVFPERSSSCEGLNGVTAVLQLLKIYGDVFIICDVCEQFKLTECRWDPDLVCLVQVAEELQSEDRRAQLTMDEAVTKMSLFNEKLVLKDDAEHCRNISELFKELKNCKALFEFAEEKGFAGKDGQKKFVTSHHLVTTQLQHEIYNAEVLNHLLGCFDYINPFLSRPSSFSDLMQLVANLPNIENGIKQLRTVNLNIGLIKTWFEGESFENVARTLKTIMKSRVILLQAVDNDPVKLTLECGNPMHGSTRAMTSDQVWSCERLKEFVAQVKFMKYEMPTEQQKHQILSVKEIDCFLDIFEKALELQSLYQGLRILQIRNEYSLYFKIECSLPYQMMITTHVEDAKKDLNTWLQSTKALRDGCQWLVFFSNRKLLHLHHYLTEKPLEKVEYIVREISVIFPNDCPTRLSQAKFVKKAVGELGAERLQSVPAIESAVVLLNKLMEYNDQYAPRQKMLVKQSSCSDHDKDARGPVTLRHFTLHYVPGFTHKQQIQLLFDILHGAPMPFQLMRCTASTTTEEIELFFQRMAWFPAEHKYVIFNTNLLSSDIQEVLVRRCLELLDSSTTGSGAQLPVLHFTETGHSVLRQMPWIFVNEHKDQDSLLTTEYVQQWFSRERIHFKKVELVYGNAGDGKTHYIKKELAKGWHDQTMTLSINECFDAVEVIKLLRNVPLEQRNFALFLNFTLPKPDKACNMDLSGNKQQQDANQEDNKQFWKLASDIHWFFFYLFVVGYIEDHRSGLSFRLPGGLQWSVFIEVPAWCNDAEESLAQFNNDIPAFHYIGEEVHIASDRPFDTDGDINVQLVCKYFRAKQTDQLDQWHHRKNPNPMPYRIGRIIKDLTKEECQQILSECLPTDIKTRPKVIQRLYLKYLERRCEILEACPALQFNEGVGEPIEVEVNGKKTVKITNIKHIRSLLFDTMKKEVAIFCDRRLDTERCHQQLIYDSAAASFKFLSLKPDMISAEERARFKETGIKIPPLKNCHNRDFLDSCLSHALKIPLVDGRISLIDEKQYVMTLDYLVKMLNIHERRKCGVPVIINGETGVGKTFLLEMLSILWNQSLLSSLDQERSSLIDILVSKLQCISDLGEHGMDSLNSPEEWFGLIISTEKKRVTSDDVDKVNSVLTALKAQDNIRNISYDSLLHVLNLPDPHEPSLQSLYMFFRSRLLQKRYDPLFSLAVFPKDIPGNSDIKSLFELASNPSDALEATAKLLYGLFAGQPKKTFHKLCVHAALTINNIKKFFEAVISEAKEILEWYVYGVSQRSSVGPHQCGPVPNLPSLTIFLDEVNTASCPGFIKEIITDRTMDGKEIPENIFIVAACNPHRANSLAAGHDEWFVGTYYVRPLHQALQMLMWNYGSLSVAREKEYINSKMSMTEPDLDSDKRTFLSNLISKSQALVRNYAAERLQSTHPSQVVEVMSKSTVSQRDIQRVFTLYKWLQQYFIALGKYRDKGGNVQILNIKIRALFVALGVVYYFRLNSECRKKFIKDIQDSGSCDHWKVSVKFKEALTDELDWTIKNMVLPPGIAKTEALKENVFAIVVCTMTRTPLIIVGQPGSSKTLSFKIVTMNLLGLGSPNPVFRNSEVFKALDPHFYQCSRKSTSVEIETVFQQAINRQASLDELGGNKLSVVMMDEAGLPERSHESLKVLHYYLDDQKVAFVGISNHILDAAKMNRAVSLFRPDICLEDVEVLASGCLLSADEPMRGRDSNYVQGFSKSYIDVMRDASIRVNSFFGLRDFIHFCSYLRRSQSSITPQLVINALERNFNGSKHFGDISCYFLERVFKIGRVTDYVKQQGVLEVLKKSLADHPKDLSAENEVRYKLLIDSSEDGSLVRLLFSFGVLKRKVTRIHMSSAFPGDSESEKLGVVAAIKHSASQGHTVVLNQTDTVHECFYDLFNQRFVCIEGPTHKSSTASSKRFYANVAIGSYIKPCPVHPCFQCVVIIKHTDLPHTPHAFLNRFEKYSLSHKQLLSDLLKYFPPILRKLVYDVRSKVSQFLACCGESSLYGQNIDTLDSLLLTILPFHLPATHADSQNCSKRVKTKEAKILAYLEWALQHHLGFRFTLSSAAELHADGKEMIMPTVYAGQLMDLAEADIPEVVDEAMIFLKQDGEPEATANTELVTRLLQQWLFMNLCKRLLQLMTPEALVTNREKIPDHYISHYLNQQSHFSFKDVAVSYYSNLVQEWSASVKDGTSLVPNKLLCYCRSSDRLHNMPHEDSNASKPFLQEFIFPDTEKLQIFRITSLTTHRRLMNHIERFNESTYEVLVLIANVEDIPLNTINHIRIIIEESEVTLEAAAAPDPKLFVLLLHFPPRFFFKHFYSSYYLHGWDHYYLDTLGAGSTNSSINIQKWFSQCCAEPSTTLAPAGSFMEPSYLDSLLSEALPLVAPHISLKGCSKTASKKLGTKTNYLSALLKRGLDQVVFSRFTTYWTPSVMIAISDQAANLARLMESTLSITDAINTIVKSNFYDFLLYILSLLNDSQALSMIATDSNTLKTPIEELIINIMKNYRIPRNLSELKMQSIRVDKQSARIANSSSYTFPFFSFVYELIEELLNQCRRELAEQIAFNEEPQGSIDSLDRVTATSQATQADICNKMVDDLERLFREENEALGEARYSERLCLNAVFVAMKNKEVRTRYVRDFCATKLSLSSDLFAKKMDDLSTECSILRRVADMHVRVRFYHFDSESLSLMRVLNELQIKYLASHEEDQCQVVGLFQKPQELFAIVIDTIYSILRKMIDTNEASVNDLKRMSSTYLQLMRLPTTSNAADYTSVAVKTKWDIIHTAMLMLNTEENLDQRFTRQVFEFFLYLHVKHIDEINPLTPPTLSSLIKFTCKYSFACSEGSIQQLLEGILEHFFPPNRAYDEQDVTWFLKQLLLDPDGAGRVFSQQPATIRYLKLYLTRILTSEATAESPEDTLSNPLRLFDDKARESVANVLMDSHAHSPFVPDFYQQCDAVHVPDIESQCLLADLYFTISLEFTRQKGMNVSYLIGQIKSISQTLASESSTPLERAILRVENQMMIHILLEKLACELHVDNAQLFELRDDINQILSDHKTGGGSDGGGHGLMLTIHMLRLHRSVYMIHRHLVTRYDDLCRDFTCLETLHCKLQQEATTALSRRRPVKNDQFPFKYIDSRKCEEGQLYKTIKSQLQVINSVAEKRHKDSVAKFMDTVTSCYTVDRRGDTKKYVFNMALLLCIYYEYYCQKKCSQVLARVLGTELRHFLDQGFLRLLVGLVDRNHLQHNPEQTAVTGSQEAVDPLYSFFTQLFRDTGGDIDPDSLAMQHSLIHLVAAIVGSPIEYTNMWYHMFSPEQLNGSYIPGFNRAAACGSEVTYNTATELSTDGLDLDHNHLLHTTRGTLNIYSRYFILWANYSALCLSLFMDSTLADRLIEAGVFSRGLPLRHYCFTRASEAWQLLSKNMNITVEERVQLVNHTIGHYYTENRDSTKHNSQPQDGTTQRDGTDQDTAPQERAEGLMITEKSEDETNQKPTRADTRQDPINTEPYESQKGVDECEAFIHNKCFVPAWELVQQKHSEVYSALSTYYSKDLRVLDEYYPQCATKDSFLLQLLSSTKLHDRTGPLYVLYQFVLRRPLFNAGGQLLPDLVDFYQWLHEELDYAVTSENAPKLSIEEAISTVIKKYDPDKRDQRRKQFDRIKTLYNRYQGRVGGELTNSTKLVELLSILDEKLAGGNILYNTIISIVDDFNQFLTAAVEHYSLRRLWRYFSNYDTPIPLDEVTVDACCFGDTLSLEDFSNLMPLVSKCCNLKRSTTAPCCDTSLFSHCVPQAYDLLQLQEDIARQFLAGKQRLQKPAEKIHREFHFKQSTPLTSESDTFFLCSMIDMTSLQNSLKSKFKDEPRPEDMKRVKYECHSFSYYTLLEVIIGLTSALNQLNKVLLDFKNEEWMPLLDETLEQFLNSHCAAKETKEVLQVIGIARFNPQTNTDVSLRDSQYNCLKNLKMRNVFKTLELLTNWMSEGVFDFCSLPFSLKMDMRVEDRDEFRSVADKSKGKAGSVLGEIKFITELLIQCEGDLIVAADATIEVKPILNVLRETAELTDEQMAGLVMSHISCDVQVQHYVHLRLELRRLRKKMRDVAAKERGSESDTAAWSSWMGGNDQDTMRESPVPSCGFGKWYEDTIETELARRADATAPLPEEEEEVDRPHVAEEWIPPESIVKAAAIRRRSTPADHSRILCSLPASKSSEVRQELKDLGNQYENFVEFLEGIGLHQVAEIVEADGFTGNIIVDDDEVLEGLEMNAVDRLRFRVLFQRELLKQTSPVAAAFPVERVVEFFKNKRSLAKYATAIEENGIDGEMLLLADSEALKLLGIPATGVKIINEQFRTLVLETLT